MNDEAKPLPEPPRRDFFKKSLTVLVGGVVATVPVATGVAVFMDPLRRGGGGKGQLVPVVPLDAVPPDGRPYRFQVIADKQDAWNKFPNTPVGAVYLKRTQKDGKDSIVAFNVTCPHAGCAVDVMIDGSFKCPCHNSHFKPDGAIDLEKGCVSARGLDALDVQVSDGFIHVRYQNFLAGTHDKIARS